MPESAALSLAPAITSPRFPTVGGAGRRAADPVALSRMALLSWADLSYVLPVTSVGYVLVALIGKIAAQ